ncbi:MAG: hypothetical protein U0930_05660 [Pirellulales bacterium]
MLVSDAAGCLTSIFRYWKIGNKSKVALIDVSGGLTRWCWLVRHRLGKGWIASLLSAPESGQDTNNAATWNAVTYEALSSLAQQLLGAIS